MKRSLRLRGGTLALATCAALAVVPQLAPGAAHADGEWRSLPVPALWPGNGFKGVAATGAGDIWVSGYQGYKCVYVWTSAYCTQKNPVIQHWDGTSWTGHNAPGITGDAELADMSASSPSNVWVAGRHGSSIVYIARWNGTGWSRPPVQQACLGSGTDPKVEAVGPDSAWVSCDSEHVSYWNGDAWTSMDPGGWVRRIRALSANEAYAATNVGVLRWNGTAWSKMPGLDGRLADVLPLAADDIWASGGTGPPAHWDGTSWSTPAASPQIQIKRFVKGGDGSVWGLSGTSHTLVRWDGTTWQAAVQPPVIAVAMTGVPGTATLFGVAGTTSAAAMTNG